MQLTVSERCLAFAAGSRELRAYAGDCLIAPETSALYAVAPSHARDRCELRDPCLANDRNLNGSPLNFVEAHAVDPPAFFCERIVPLMCLLVLSTTRVEREVAENTAL